MAKPNWNSINRRIEKCKACPRLIDHCNEIAAKKRRAYLDDNYWGGPVGNFGDANARLLVVGLAPGAHGANRTGRMFTGDRSGDWLFRALHKAGFASRNESTWRGDGLELNDCAITNVCHCAPPENKPTKEELTTCRPFLNQTIELLPIVVFLALGQLAWKAMLDWAIEASLLDGKRPKFGHGAEVQFDSGQWLIGSYHPSQQNTFTGKLTEKMLDRVMRACSKRLGAARCGR